MQCSTLSLRPSLFNFTDATRQPAHAEERRRPDASPCAGFLDHEFFKHASCYGNYFTTNSTAFFETAVSYAKELTGPGSTGAAIAARAGGNVSVADLTALLNGTASVQCNKRCQLSEVWNCLVRPRPLCYPSEVLVPGVLPSHSSCINL